MDASYGSLKMYDCDNLKLVAKIASEVVNTPIVILHSGGSRIFDAMLLVESAPNIFLETSFSLPYYIGSNIESDMAFAYKKIGPDKIIYASDYPYIQHDISLCTALEFFDRHNFYPRLTKLIFNNSFARVFNRTS